MVLFSFSFVCSFCSFEDTKNRSFFLLSVGRGKPYFQRSLAKKPLTPAFKDIVSIK